jgi:alpha-L-fucosidase
MRFFKTLDHLLDIYYGAVGGNAQLLLNIPPDRRGRLPENDILALRRLGDRLRATFAVNLAAGAKAVAARIGSAASEQGPEKTIDSIPKTAWMTGDGVTSTAVVYDLGRSKTFNVAMLQEDIRTGQRVESFALDAWDGKEWQEIGRGTTVGYKRLLRFPGVKSGEVRLRILKARAPAAISEFGLYLDPARAAGREFCLHRAANSLYNIAIMRLAPLLTKGK